MSDPTKKAIKRRKKRTVKLIGTMGPRALEYRLAEIALEHGLLADYETAAAFASIALQELRPILEAQILTELKEKSE